MSLHHEHLADLERSGLTLETIQAAQIHTISLDEINKKLGGLANGVLSALAFPYPGCDGYERYKVWRGEGQEGPKYLQPPGSPNHLYLVPGLDLAGEAPLIITEGEKKCIALWQAGHQAVGVGGVWNWLGAGDGCLPGSTKPIPDLDRVNWQRPVVIVFDSDGHGNPRVRLAAFRLARELSRRGATVNILFIPCEVGQ